jgi:hypothetical protein
VPITHNNYVHDGLVYQSNYTSGLRVFDTAPIADGDLEPVGFFDTFPAYDAPTFEGTWSNYPFFESGTIAVSGIDEGLFLLRLVEEEVEVPALEVVLTCEDCPVRTRAGDEGTAALLVTGEGTYELAVDGAPDGWDVTVDPEPVEADGAATLTVVVPEDERPGRRTLTVTATAVDDADVSDSTDVPVVVQGGPPQAGGGPTGQGGETSAAPSGDGDGATATAASTSSLPVLPAVALLALLVLALSAAPTLARRLSRP